MTKPAEAPTTITLTLPDRIDAATPQETVLEAVKKYELSLIALVGYAQRLEVQVLNAAMQDADDVPAVLSPGDGSLYNYAQGTLELAKITRANGAIGLAARLVGDLRRRLETPLLERD